MQAPILQKKLCNFGGTLEFYSHPSTSTHSEMKFSVFRPAEARTQRLPVLYWLSGLTCTEENVMQKSGAQAYAAAKGILLVAPDTSPRGLGLPGEKESWDFGEGAGFYVNATRDPWKKNYQMYDYVVKELPALVGEFFPAETHRQSIFGHSMGGHGALVAALRNPSLYRSVSAFAPISSPMQVPWGQKAFNGYLGSDQSTWEQYDASRLIGAAKTKMPILIDQGSDDNFLKEQLRPELFAAACEKAAYPLSYRLQKGYDHSYYFIASFMKDHFDHHWSHLK